MNLKNAEKVKYKWGKNKMTLSMSRKTKIIRIFTFIVKK